MGKRRGELFLWSEEIKTVVVNVGRKLVTLILAFTVDNLSNHHKKYKENEWDSYVLPVPLNPLWSQRKEMVEQPIIWKDVKCK